MEIRINLVYWCYHFMDFYIIYVVVFSYFEIYQFFTKLVGFRVTIYPWNPGTPSYWWRCYSQPMKQLIYPGRQQVGVDWLKWPIRWLSSYSSWWIVLRLIVIVKVDLCFKNGSFQVLSFSSPSRYRSMIGTFWSSLQFLLSVLGLVSLLAGWKEGW